MASRFPDSLIQTEIIDWPKNPDSMASVETVAPE